MAIQMDGLLNREMDSINLNLRYFTCGRRSEQSVIVWRHYGSQVKGEIEWFILYNICICLWWTNCYILKNCLMINYIQI